MGEEFYKDFGLVGNSPDEVNIWPETPSFISQALPFDTNVVITTLNRQNLEFLLEAASTYENNKMLTAPKVTVLDNDAYSFRRLSADFKGTALVGNGLDQEVLKRAGIEEADAFVAVTQGDNRNVMAAQIAKHIFNVPKVTCRIYDPLRRDLYRPPL